MTEIFNRVSEITKRKTLRRNMSFAENVLWAKLKTKQIGGYKLRRQYSIDRFVVDFYCPRAKLVIEIDGDSHFNKQAKLYDKERERLIKSLGLKILRFTNTQIRTDLKGVLTTIASYLTSPSLSFVRRG